MWMLAEGRYQSWMSIVDLLERQSMPLLHQVDEAEVSRSEHDDRVIVQILLALRCLRACSVARLVEREAYRRVVLVASEKRLHRPRLDRAANQVVQRVSVALLERRALRLPVIGEDDDLVRARSVSAGPCDSPELLVELAERLDRVVPLETGVRHLVVAGQRVA